LLEALLDFWLTTYVIKAGAALITYRLPTMTVKEVTVAVLSTLNDAITTNGSLADVAAGIVINHVSVITLFDASLYGSISAESIFAREASIVVVLVSVIALFVIVVDDAITAELRLASRVTAIVVTYVAVIASFDACKNEAITTQGGDTGI
jgi:hypothetical protein